MLPKLLEAMGVKGGCLLELITKTILAVATMVAATQLIDYILTEMKIIKDCLAMYMVVLLKQNLKI